jgi:3-oxoadipate enol-lactonase
LIIAGQYDPVTTVADADWLGKQLPRASVLTLPASHLSSIEGAREFNDILLRFLPA